MLRVATRNDPGDAATLLDSASALISLAERADALARPPLWGVFFHDVRYCLRQTAVIGATNDVVMHRLASLEARAAAAWPRQDAV